MSLKPWNRDISLLPTVKYFSGLFEGVSPCWFSWFSFRSALSPTDETSCSVNDLLLTSRSLLEKLHRFLIFFHLFARATGGDMLIPCEVNSKQERVIKNCYINLTTFNGKLQNAWLANDPLTLSTANTWNYLGKSVGSLQKICFNAWLNASKWEAVITEQREQETMMGPKSAEGDKKRMMNTLAASFPTHIFWSINQSLQALLVLKNG